MAKNFTKTWSSASVNLKQTIVDPRLQSVGIGHFLLAGMLSVGGGIFQLIAAVIIAGVLLCTGRRRIATKIFTKLARARR